VLNAALETEVTVIPSVGFLPQSADGQQKQSGERLIAKEKEG